MLGRSPPSVGRDQGRSAVESTRFSVLLDRGFKEALRDRSGALECVRRPSRTWPMSSWRISVGGSRTRGLTPASRIGCWQRWSRSYRQGPRAAWSAVLLRVHLEVRQTPKGRPADSHRQADLTAKVMRCLRSLQKLPAVVPASSGHLRWPRQHRECRLTKASVTGHSNDLLRLLAGVDGHEPCAGKCPPHWSRPGWSSPPEA